MKSWGQSCGSHLVRGRSSSHCSQNRDQNCDCAIGDTLQRINGAENVAVTGEPNGQYAPTKQRHKVQDLKSPPECFESAWPIPPSHFGRLVVSRCGLTLVLCQ